MGNSVKLDGGIGFAIEHHVDLGLFLMVMLAGVLADLRQVNSAGKLIAVGEGSTGDAAGAGDPGQAVQIDDLGWSSHVAKSCLAVGPANHRWR